MNEVFLASQEERIRVRLARYNNLAIVREQLQELGEPTPYQIYKMGVVSTFLRRALEKIKNGKYGICEVCGKEISEERLKIVPGALAHVMCDHKKK